MRWVMDQRPDIVEGYVSGSALLTGANAEEVLGAVFLRRDFWETHPQRSRLDCVSVSETTLARSRPGELHWYPVSCTGT